ncbi:hypothetical protein G6F50_016922 [Rhizopus delemar]|uniref:Uncharacterized protein n=1 Tax=Rhizopus delemar TaxID=936053 RepID=A0A9P6XRS2_9FUNG|nr:hypothetical protein G6F50_016922 [Rhizopus delemar]
MTANSARAFGGSPLRDCPPSGGWLELRRHLRQHFLRPRCGRIGHVVHPDSHVAPAGRGAGIVAHLLQQQLEFRAGTADAGHFVRNAYGRRIRQRAQEIARGMGQDGAVVGRQLEARVVQDLHARLFHQAEIQRVVQMIQGV